MTAVVKRPRGRPKKPEKTTTLWVTVAVRDKLNQYREIQAILPSKVVRNPLKINNDAIKELLELWEVISLSMPNMTSATIISEARRELGKQAEGMA